VSKFSRAAEKFFDILCKGNRIPNHAWRFFQKLFQLRLPFFDRQSLKVLAVQPEQIKRVINDWRLLLGEVLEQLKTIEPGDVCDTCNDTFFEIKKESDLQCPKKSSITAATFLALRP
jgi:hypothetical protein